MTRKGVFICVEGLDGCGKTTQTRLLVKALKKEGFAAVYTAEPSNSEVGRFIRRYCLHGEKRGFAVVETLLFAADRFEHVEKEVLPALEKGRIVVSDRYVYSSLAYQGAAGLSLEWIWTINEHAVKPDLAVFLDVKPETVVRRLKPVRSVMENLETQREVRGVYLEFVENGELVRVDGNKSEKEVAEEIMRVVQGFLAKTGFRTV